MTDQTVGLPSRTPRLSRLRSLAARLLRRIELRPRAAWAVAALIAAGLMRHFWLDEGTFPNILFTAGVTLALIAFVVLLTRRVLFATALMASLIARDRGRCIDQARAHEHGRCTPTTSSSI